MNIIQLERIGNIEIIENNELEQEVRKSNDSVILARYNRDITKIFYQLVVEKKVKIKLRNTAMANSIVEEMERAVNTYINRYNKCENVDAALRNYMIQQEIPLKKKDRNRDQEELLQEKYKEFVLEEKAINKEIFKTKSKQDLSYLKICIEEYSNKGEGYKSDEENEKEAPHIMYLKPIISFINYYCKQRSETDLVKEFLSFIKDFLKANEYDNVPILSTIHMYKGEEIDNVIIYDYPRFPYVSPFKDDEQNLQEENLQYIALTRPKKNLILVMQNEPIITNSMDEEEIEKIEKIIKRNNMVKDQIKAIMK